MCVGESEIHAPMDEAVKEDGERVVVRREARTGLTWTALAETLNASWTQRYYEGYRFRAPRPCPWSGCSWVRSERGRVRVRLPRR